MRHYFQSRFGMVSLLVFSFLTLFAFGTPVSASTVTLAPTSGVAGQIVIITGSAFDNSSTATILWDDVALTTIPATVTTSGTGAIPLTGTVSFVVPSGAYGAHVVKVSTGTSNVGVATFTVNTPTVAVTSPPSGIASGVTLTVIATNMEASKITTFYFDDIVVGTNTSTVGGVAELVFAVPVGQNTGTHVIRASNSVYTVASTTIAIATPAITLSPATGAIGTKVSVTGTNFRANNPVSFFMNGTDLVPDTSITANGSGGFAATFTVPVLAAGANTVKVQSDATLFATATYTVTTPALTLSPITGADGLTITASGTGFLANSTVRFYVNDAMMDDTATTNEFGAFKKSVELPSSFPTGALTIRAQTSDINFATATYTVVSAAFTASLTAGVPGTQVTLTGTNFDPNKKVTVRWNGENIETSKNPLKTNSSGSFLTKITIPADYVSGNGQIEVFTSEMSRALTTFTIANPTLTLAPVAGLPGSIITVSGTNFEGKKILKLLWDNDRIATKPASVITTPLGGFVAVFAVPEKASRGVHSVVAMTEGSGKITFSTTFTVTAPSLLSSVSTIQAHTKVSITGTGFVPGKPVGFSWDNGDILVSEPETVLADEAGFFSASVSIPENVTPGAHILKAFASESIFATLSFTITTGTITLSKDNGSPRDTVQVTGSGFDARKSVTFLWDGASFETPAVETDSIGGFMATLTLPASPSGMHSIKAMTSEFAAATEDFGVNAPSLSVNPVSGRSRGTITLSGMNFVAGRKVIVTVNDTEMKTEGGAMTDGSGNFTTSVKLPFTFADSVHIGVKTGSEDQQLVDLPIIQWTVVQTIKRYGEWGAMAVFALFILFVVGRFGLLRKGINYGRTLVSGHPSSEV